MADLIHIPEPCHEDWDDMRPEANGRHCLQCCKTVVDFTGWEVEAIANYLKHTKGNTCGRFTADQVQQPAPPQPGELARYVIRASMPFYRKLAAMIVLFFGLSVTEGRAQRTTGGAAMPTVQQPIHDTTWTAAPVMPVTVMGAAPVPVVQVADTAKYHVLMGKPALPRHPKEVKGRVAPVRPTPKPRKTPEHLQGDVQLVTDPPPKQKKP